MSFQLLNFTLWLFAFHFQLRAFSPPANTTLYKNPRLFSPQPLLLPAVRYCSKYCRVSLVRTTVSSSSRPPASTANQIHHFPFFAILNTRYEILTTQNFCSILHRTKSIKHAGIEKFLLKSVHFCSFPVHFCSFLRISVHFCDFFAFFAHFYPFTCVYD